MTLKGRTIRKVMGEAEGGTFSACMIFFLAFFFLFVCLFVFFFGEGKFFSSAAIFAPSTTISFCYLWAETDCILCICLYLITYF